MHAGVERRGRACRPVQSSAPLAHLVPGQETLARPWVKFSGGEVRFARARFTGGKVSFCGAEFSVGAEPAPARRPRLSVPSR
jgi:hypothetical protein